MMAETKSRHVCLQKSLCFSCKAPMGLLSACRPISCPTISSSFSKRKSPFLEGREFNIFPDFPTGGIMDASDYDKRQRQNQAARKNRVSKIPKTLVITEICYGTTTESLIRSIDEAAKRGKIKIEAINDYTADKVEIEIKLPRGQYAEESDRCSLCLYRM